MPKLNQHCGKAEDHGNNSSNKMHHPYQCIRICRQKVENDGKLYLLAASGSRLFSLEFDGGAIVSSWPKEDIEDAPVSSVNIDCLLGNFHFTRGKC